MKGGAIKPGKEEVERVYNPRRSAAQKRGRRSDARLGGCSHGASERVSEWDERDTEEKRKRSCYIYFFNVVICFVFFEQKEL